MKAIYDPATGDLWVWKGEDCPEWEGHFDDSGLALSYCNRHGIDMLDAGTIPQPTPEQLKRFSDKLRAIRCF